MNAIRVIHPYWDEKGSLVFDDASVGLVAEPFVAGADDVLKLIATGVEGCEDRFTLLFSHEPFPGHQASMRKTRPEYGGNWYVCDAVGMEGWLCPALYKYYDVAPEHLYIQIKPQQ